MSAGPEFETCEEECTYGPMGIHAFNCECSDCVLESKDVPVNKYFEFYTDDGETKIKVTYPMIFNCYRRICSMITTYFIMYGRRYFLPGVRKTLMTGRDYSSLFHKCPAGTIKLRKYDEGSNVKGQTIEGQDFLCPYELARFFDLFVCYDDNRLKLWRAYKKNFKMQNISDSQEKLEKKFAGKDFVTEWLEDRAAIEHSIVNFVKFVNDVSDEPIKCDLKKILRDFA